MCLKFRLSLLTMKKYIPIETDDYYLTAEGYRCLQLNTTSNAAIAARVDVSIVRMVTMPGLILKTQ